LHPGGGNDLEPALTVVIPVWGVYAAYLPSALRSLRSQDSRCRVLVVDNAGGLELTQTQRVEVVRSEQRLTLGGARNLGVSRTETEWVMVWDADDLLTAGALSTLLDEVYRAGPEVVAVGMAILDAATRRRHRWPRPWAMRLLRWPKLFAAINTVWSMFPTTGVTIMRTDVVKACGGYIDADSGDDWALGVALAFRGCLRWIERPGRVYSDTKGSIWARHSALADLFRHARAIRRRVSSDPMAPHWAKSLLPVVAAAQCSAVLVHALLELARALRAGSVGLSRPLPETIPGPGDPQPQLIVATASAATRPVASSLKGATDTASGFGAAKD
jgi:glycosyltransferase involved in cell wall biosynthesis